MVVGGKWRRLRFGRDCSHPASHLIALFPDLDEPPSGLAENFEGWDLRSFAFGRQVTVNSTQDPTKKKSGKRTVRHSLLQEQRQDSKSAESN